MLQRSQLIFSTSSLSARMNIPILLKRQKGEAGVARCVYRPLEGFISEVYFCGWLTTGLRV